MKIHSEKLVALLAERKIVVSARWLRRLAKEKHLFPEPIREEYECQSTLLGLIEHYHTLYHGGSGTLNAIEERTALAKCLQEEIKTSRAQEQVEDIAEVERSRIALVVMIRQKLLAMPAKAASYLACCTDERQILSELEKQIESILRELETPAFSARPDTVTKNGQAEQSGA